MIRQLYHRSKIGTPLLSGHAVPRYFLSGEPNNPNPNAPNPQQNDNKQKQKQKDKHEGKEPRNIKFGFRHPLQRVMQKQVLQKMKQNHKLKSMKQKSDNFFLKQEEALKWRNDILSKVKSGLDGKKQASQKDKQKQKEKEKDDKKANSNTQDQSKKSSWTRTAVSIGVFYLLLSLFDNKQRPKKLDEKANIQFIINEIQKCTEPSSVLVQRNGMREINLICQVGSTKKYGIKVDEAELVYFLEKLELIKGGATQVHFAPNYINTSKAGAIAMTALKVILFGGLALILWKAFKSVKNQAGNIGNILSAKKFEAVQPEQIKIQFGDVAGMHEAKFEITEFVEFLKRPEKYIEMGAKVPKGALLTGPPGTGKTLLAKACAGEAGVPFFSVSGSDFVEKYSGLGASRVRNLFDEAQKNAPSIIFIDQIDAIGKKRDGGPFSNEERDNTLNQLLVRMDGFDTKNKVIVMAATNRKDMLDPALLRPGRFDRSVQIGLPNLEERAEILKVHLKKVKYDPNLSQDELATKLARLTPGFSGAQLANTCNEAAILAARDKMEYISIEKFEKATERVMAGLEKRNQFTPEEKEMLAFYEAGKAVANWFTEGADPVIKISILPFSKSKAGYSHSIKDETALNTMDELLAKVCCYLAGRSSELHFKGHVTTNGNKDLERAKKIITMIVTKFGMSDALKMFAFPDFDFTRKPYSEKTEAMIDAEIAKITEQCQKKVQQLIRSKQQQILKLKQKLLEKQTLSHNDIKQILGDRPFGANQNYRQFLKDQEQETSKSDQAPGAGAATG